MKNLSQKYGGEIFFDEKGYGRKENYGTGWGYKDSFVYDVFGKTRAIVNCHHGLCIDRLAPVFRCVARSDDGEIEAIEWKEKNIFATQWHPEQTLHGAGDPMEHKFFENFLKRCEECQTKS